MAMAEKINKMIRQISYKIGVNLPDIDKNGVCSMIYNKKFEFNIEVPPGDNQMFFYAPILKNAQHNLAFHKKLLELNFMCRETDGTTISLDEENDDVVLCLRQDATHLTEEKFNDDINAFLKTAEKSQDIVNRLQQNHWTPDEQPGTAATGVDAAGMTMKV